MERKHLLAECEKCPLNGPENKFVPTQFSPQPAELVVVGEAPGWQEALYGKPFTGPSGKLIKEVLSHHRIPKDATVFTNVCLCRPPDNATPPKAAVAACRGRLLAEIDASGARDVLALGGTAASALVDDTRTITRLRVGPPKSPTQRLANSAVERVVPTWHPAYCLRTADAFPALVSDVGKLRDSRSEPWTEPEWRSFDDAADILEAIADLDRRAVTLVIDIEVGVDKDGSFDHPNEYDLLCVGIGYAKGRAVVFGGSGLKEQHVLDALRDLLGRKRLVAHNGKFDLAGLYPHLGPLKLWFDTMLASYVIDERPGNHGLKVLAVEKLGAPKYDDEIRQFVPRGGNYGDIPRPILYRYNALDVGCTWDLYEMFEARLARDDLRRVHDFLVAASNELMFLELNGIPIDAQYNAELSKGFLERLEELEKELDQLVHEVSGGNIPFINPRSPKQIKEFLASRDIHVDTTDADMLQKLFGRARPGSPTQRFLAKLLEHRREQKIYGTFVKGIRQRMYRGRVYTTYLLHGSTSGRLASRNPNLQNIVRSKEIRRQFTVSKDTNTLIQADYKQAEGRVITTLARDEYLRSIFADEERDLFDELSNQLYGVGNWAKEERVRTKAFFYGLGYGREAASIAAEFGMSIGDTNVLLRNFMDLIPATAQWQRDVKRRVLNGEDLVTPFGRRRRFHLITNQNQKDVLNEALSYLPQSTASDICLSALIRLRPLLKGMGWIRLTIHDALVVECPKARQEEVSELLKNTMVDCGREFTDFVPFAVDLSYGQSWGDL